MAWGVKQGLSRLLTFNACPLALPVVGIKEIDKEYSGCVVSCAWRDGVVGNGQVYILLRSLSKFRT